MQACSTMHSTPAEEVEPVDDCSVMEGTRRCAERLNQPLTYVGCRSLSRLGFLLHTPRKLRIAAELEDSIVVP